MLAVIDRTVDQAILALIEKAGIASNARPIQCYHVDC